MPALDQIMEAGLDRIRQGTLRTAVQVDRLAEDREPSADGGDFGGGQHARLLVVRQYGLGKDHEGEPAEWRPEALAA
jgi:hypothetical protein